MTGRTYYRLNHGHYDVPDTTEPIQIDRSEFLTLLQLAGYRDATDELWLCITCDKRFPMPQLNDHSLTVHGKPAP